MKCQKVKKESLAAARQQEIIRACEELYETMEYEDISIKEMRNPPPSAVLIYTTIIRQKTRSFWISWRKIIFPGQKTSGRLWTGRNSRDGKPTAGILPGRRLFIQAAETDGSPLYHHREELLPGKADGF